MMHRIGLSCLICALSFAVACGGVDIDDEADDTDNATAESSTVDANYDNETKNDTKKDGKYADWHKHDNLNYRSDKKHKKDSKYIDWDKHGNLIDWYKHKDKKDKKDGKRDKKKKDTKEDIKRDYKACKKFQDEYMHRKDEFLKKCKKDNKKSYYQVCKTQKKFWAGLDCKAYKGCKTQEGYQRCKNHKKKWGETNCKKFAKNEASDYLSSGIDADGMVYFGMRDMTAIFKNCAKQKKLTSNCKYANKFSDFMKAYKSGEFVSGYCVNYDRLVEDCKEAKERRLARLHDDKYDGKKHTRDKTTDKVFYEKVTKKSADGCKYAEKSDKYVNTCGCDCTVANETDGDSKPLP